MKTTRRQFLQAASALLLGTAGLAHAEENPVTTAKTVRLLNVGNSFSANATQHLGALAKAAGHVLVHRQASLGGATMEQHWNKAQIHERDPEAAEGLYKNGRSLKQELRAEPWDVVTIQQASIRSHDVATYRPFAQQLRDFIKRHAPTAEVVLHQTWAYRVDDPRFTKPATKPGEPATQQAMYEGLSRAYRAVAAELGLRIVPVGDAFYAADTDAQWGYQPDREFDFSAAKPPTLPRQTNSLHTGWRWRTDKGKTSLSIDGHHASTAGCYLGACVFYEFLFGESVLANGYVPRGLDAAHARFLRETAHATVAKVTAEFRR